MINLETSEHSFYKKYYKTAYGQFDKYYLFIERAIEELLSDNGLLGMIISRKFMYVKAGKQLRKLLSDKVSIVGLVDFGNAQLFESRITYTCLLYLSTDLSIIQQESPFPYQLITTPSEWLNQQYGSPATFTLPKSLVTGEDSWVLPSSKQEVLLLEAMFNDSIPLKSIADVDVGIQTSCNDVYVITDWTEVDSDIISFNKKGKTWKIEKKILKPFFEDKRGRKNKESRLRSFYPLPSTAFVIYPYSVSSTGKKLEAKIIPSNTMQITFPLAYQWLQHNRNILESRKMDSKHSGTDEWYRYGRSQALTAFENRPKIVVGINSLGDKYVYDDTNTLLASGDTAGECSIAVYRDEPEKSSYDLYFLLALLNHKAVEYFCRKAGSTFQNGWYSRGASVLKRIPVPLVDFTSNNERRYLYENIVLECKELCEICKSLSSATTNADRIRLERRKTHLKQSMDAQISTLYGVAEIIDNVELPQ